MTCYEQVDEVLRESSSAIATIVKALLYEKEKRITELEAREQDAMIFEEHFCEEHRMQCGEMTEHPECIWCRAEKAEAFIAGMVKKAADKSLDGYRELGARAAKAENERDAAIKEIGVQARKLGYAQASNARLRELLRHVKEIQRRDELTDPDRAASIWWKEEVDKRVAAALTPTVSDVCVWSEDLDGPWETGCREAFTFTDGGPEENGVRYCPYCGKRIEIDKQEATDGTRHV